MWFNGVWCEPISYNDFIHATEASGVSYRVTHIKTAKAGGRSAKPVKQMFIQNYTQKITYHLFPTFLTQQNKQEIWGQ